MEENDGGAGKIDRVSRALMDPTAAEIHHSEALRTKEQDQHKTNEEEWRDFGHGESQKVQHQPLKCD